MQARRTLPTVTALCIGVCAIAPSPLCAADVLASPVQERVQFNAPVGGITLFKVDPGIGVPEFGRSTSHGIRLYSPAAPHFFTGSESRTDFKADVPGLRIALPSMTTGWRGSHLPQTEVSNPISRTLQYMSQFYGHSPSGAGQNSLIRREQMHGRSVHLHVRF